MPNDVLFSLRQLEQTLRILSSFNPPLYEELAPKWVWARSNLVGTLYNKVCDNHYLWIGERHFRQSLHFDRAHDRFWVTGDSSIATFFQTWEDAFKVFIYGREGSTIKAVHVTPSGSTLSIVFKGTLDSGS